MNKIFFKSSKCLEILKPEPIKRIEAKWLHHTDGEMGSVQGDAVNSVCGADVL